MTHLSGKHKPISQRAARRMRTQLARAREDPFTFMLTGESRRVDLKDAAPNLKAWIRGVQAAGGLVTVVVEGSVGSEVVVFTPRSAQ